MKNTMKVWGIGLGVIFGISVSILLLSAMWAPKVYAYESWDAGCVDCHGDFLASPYSSLQDGTNWGTSLMSGHASMVSSDCNVCHQPPSGTPRTPVYIGLSAGGTGFSPISCLGCHGRQEDAQGASACVDGDPTTIDTANCGMGAGLRQHHYNAGETECAFCHADANPAGFTVVGENIMPPYYFTPDAAHPDKPIDPCNAAAPPGNENKFGPTGLDNDGNDLYDGADPSCAVALPPAPADFNGDGTSDIGVYRNATFYLDLNDNSEWDGCTVDGCYVFGSAGDEATVGDWTGSGHAMIGVFRDGGWYLDLNGDNEWNGCEGGDGCYVFGSAGAQPVVGDWMGTGQISLGVFQGGGWYLDLNGNNQWDGCEGGDGCYVFGSAGDQPVVGDWTGSGQLMIGVYRDGGWYLDLNGNNQWDGCEVDGCFVFGLTGDIAANELPPQS